MAQTSIAASPPPAPISRRRVCAAWSRRRATPRGARCRSSKRARRCGARPRRTRRSRPRRSIGETVTVYDESEGWAWAQLERDLYVGYLPLAALGPPAAPTHRVAALRTHAYPGPSIKLPPRMALSLGARLTIVRTRGRFRGQRGRAVALGRAIWRRSARASRTSLRSPSVFSRRPISGAGGRPRGSTARAWRRPR